MNWTGRSLKDQEINFGVRVFGSVLVALSGLLLVLVEWYRMDEVFVLGLTQPSYFYQLLVQTISPLLLLFGQLLRPFKTAYLLPVYVYAVQFCGLIYPELHTGGVLLKVSAFGLCLLYLFLLFVLRRAKLFHDVERIANRKFREEAEELIASLKKEKL